MCCRCARCTVSIVQVTVVTILSMNILLYRIGLMIIGYKGLSDCLGSLTQVLSISPHVADIVMKVVLGYLVTCGVVLSLRRFLPSGEWQFPCDRFSPMRALLVVATTLSAIAVYYGYVCGKRADAAELSSRRLSEMSAA